MIPLLDTNVLIRFLKFDSDQKYKKLFGFNSDFIKSRSMMKSEIVRKQPKYSLPRPRD